jgi:hypothetical protein
MKLIPRSYFPPSDQSRAKHVERAILASVWDFLDGNKRSAAKIAQLAWPDDLITQSVLTPSVFKAASVPADTATPAWAATLAPTMVGDFVASLQPMSAAAKLIDAGIRLSLSGIYALNIPKRNSPKAATDVAWAAEGQPIAVKLYTLNTVALGPTHKLPLIVALTRELAEHANGQEVITTLIKEDLAASLDASLFSTAAADTTRCAGLMNGISALPATAATPNVVEACYGDLANIAGAIADAGGSGNVVYIASPKQYASAKVRLLTEQTIWACPALAAGTVIGVDPSAFVSAFGPEPKIKVSWQAAEVEASPAAPISTGSPAVVGTPLRSVFQTDTISIRTILDAAWCMRQPGMVAYVTGANW